MTSAITSNKFAPLLIRKIELESKDEPILCSPTSPAVEIDRYQQHLYKLSHIVGTFRAAHQTQIWDIVALARLETLPPEIQNMVFEALWIARNRPMPGSPIAHEDFGRVSFFNKEARCASTSLQKAYAIEQIFPLLATRAAFQDNQPELAYAIFDTLPEHVKNRVFYAHWEHMGKPSSQSPNEELKKIAHPDFGRVSFLGTEPRSDAAPTEKVKTLSACLDAIVKSQTLFDKALEGLSEKNWHFLFIDADCWTTPWPLLLNYDNEASFNESNQTFPPPPPEVDPYLFDRREPGYYAGMMKGLYYVRQTIGMRFNADHFCQLHDLCIDNVFRDQHKTERFSKGYDGGWHYGIRWKLIPKMTKEELEREKVCICVTDHQGEAIYLDKFLSYVVKTDDGFKLYGNVKKGLIKIIINEQFNKYYQSIESAVSNDDKLAAICRLCRALEMSHVFPDGNGRTIVFALLTKLLIENGFSPAILDQVTRFDAGYFSVKEMTENLNEGLDNYKKLIEALNDPIQTPYT